MKDKTTTLAKEFKAFIAKGSVVELAVGIVIGAAFAGVVNSLVKDILTPPIGYILGGINFSGIVIRIAPTVEINVGLFIQQLVNFIIVSLAIFILIKILSKTKIYSPSTPPSTPEDVLLLREIRDNLKKDNSGEK